MAYVEPSVEAVRLLQKAENDLGVRAEHLLAVADRYINLTGMTKGTRGVYMPDEVAVAQTGTQVTVSIKKGTSLSPEDIGRIVTMELMRGRS